MSHRFFSSIFGTWNIFKLSFIFKKWFFNKKSFTILLYKINKGLHMLFFVSLIEVLYTIKLKKWVFHNILNIYWIKSFKNWKKIFNFYDSCFMFDLAGPPSNNTQVSLNFHLQIFIFVQNCYHKLLYFLYFCFVVDVL